MTSRPRWDIFCQVVDHYGDIGVSWRLARQLRDAHHMDVLLYVDDLDTFHRLAPGVDPSADVQFCEGIKVVRWGSDTRFEPPGDVVLDAFGSRAPEPFLEAMANASPPPVWINLEYLSAETWIEDCHRMTSPHPRLPLVRHFFFPGFSRRTGGVLEEPGLARSRLSFLADAGARSACLGHWLASPPDPLHATVVTLFGYGGPGVSSLMRAWADAPEPVCALVPQGSISLDVQRFLGLGRLDPGSRHFRGALEVQSLPFRSQDDYDRLLWSADCNFVRGEDSFVRAQWAEHPFVWNIYPQEGGAHWTKMHAFVDRYGSGLEPDTAQAVRELWRLWNRGETSSAVMGGAWRRFWSHADDLRAHNAGWAAHLRSLGDLATNLVRFAVERL